MTEAPIPGDAHPMETYARGPEVIQACELRPVSVERNAVTDEWLLISNSIWEGNPNAHDQV